MCSKFCLQLFVGVECGGASLCRQSIDLDRFSCAHLRSSSPLLPLYVHLNHLGSSTNSLNLGENSWQRNRDVCVGCSEEKETLEHFILHCPRWEEWRIESRSLQRPRIEETDQVLGEFLFGRHESNTKKRTLLKTWNERQRLIRNNQENAET